MMTSTADSSRSSSSNTTSNNNHEKGDHGNEKEDSNESSNNSSSRSNFCYDIELVPSPSTSIVSSTFKSSCYTTKIGSITKNSNTKTSLLCNGAVLHYPSNSIYGLSTKDSSSTTTSWYLPSKDGTSSSIWEGLVSSSNFIICVRGSNGDVSLVDGLSGTILVTRRILPSSALPNSRRNIVMGFVVKETLDTSSGDALFLAGVEERNILLVYDIQKDSISSMKLVSIPFKECHTIQQICAYFITPTKLIQFIVLSDQGQIESFQYDLSLQACLDTNNNTATASSPILEEEQRCCCRVGLSYYHTNFLSYAINDAEKYYLQWLHLPSMTKSDKFCVSTHFTTTTTAANSLFLHQCKSTKVLNVEPVSTFNSEEAIGAAVATVQLLQNQQLSVDFTTPTNHSQQSKQFGIYIVQLLKDNNKLTNLHLLFYIPLEYYYFSNTCKLRLTSCSLVAPTTTQLTQQPYQIQMALLYSFSTDPNSNNSTVLQMRCKSFLPTNGSIVGKFHSLIAKQKYQEADTYYWQQLLSEEMQQWMHPSHVALAQLSFLLVHGQQDEDEIGTCLMRLKTAVIAEKQQLSVASACLVQAVTVLTSSGASIQKKKGRILLMIHALSEICTTKRNTSSSLYKALKKKLEAYVTTITIASQIQVPDGMEESKTTSQLFCSLVSCGHYEKADQVRCLDSTHISKETIVYAVSKISSTTAESWIHYVIYWISHCILPHIHSVYDPVWKHICDWSYTMACNSSEETAISILQCICESTSHLEAKIFLSTSWNKHILSSYNNNNNNISTMSLSFQEKTYDASIIFDDNIYNDANSYATPTVLEVSATKKIARRVLQTPEEEDKNADDDNITKNKLELCREKLRQARMLKDARNIGLPNYCLTLSNFEELGGSFYLVVQLLRWYLTSAKMDQLLVSNIIQSHILPFCRAHGISNIEEILEFYAKERLEEAIATCSGNGNYSVEKENLSLVLLIFHEITFLSNCTSSLKSRGGIVLQILRSGLLFSELLITHDDNDIMKLESLAKNVAQELQDIDPLLSSEVKEAFRLLQIDAILCQYCGRDARIFFRVNYPDHMRSLIRHVCRFIHSKHVLDHVITLCDASLASLDKVEAVTDLLCRIMLAEQVPLPKESSFDESQENVTENQNFRSRQCGEILDSLLRKDADFTAKVATSSLRFAQHTIEECAVYLNRVINHEEEKALQEKSRAAVSISLSIASVLKEAATQNKLPNKSIEVTLCYCCSTWAEIWSDFRRLQLLQTHYSIYLSVRDLQDRRHLVHTMPHLLQPAVSMIKEMQNQTSAKQWESFENNNTHENDWVLQLKSKLARARRGCTLLCNSESETHGTWWQAIANSACKLLNESGDVACFLLLRLSGLLEENASATSSFASESTSMALLSVAEALFSSASDAVAAIRQKSCRVSGIGYADSDSDGEAEYLREPVGGNIRDSSVFKSMLLIVRSSFLIQQYCMVNAPFDKFPEVVATARLIDLISETLVRADSGFGEALEKKRHMIYENSVKTMRDNIVAPSIKVPPLPKLHPTWYVGDGLLLPPLETLILSLEQWQERDSDQFASAARAACGESIFSNKSWSAHGDLLSLLNSRGAHTLALRLLTFYSFDVVHSGYAQSDEKTTVESFLREKLQTLYQGTIRYLAERSLGGAGAGITSGAIDSNLSVAHLLCLPHKLGFKIYRASLPPAINRRDFDRVLTLSVIGVCAAGGGKIYLPSTVGWRNQQTFLLQCQNLASYSFWWNLLKTYRLEFDPGLFEHHKGDKVARYASSLLPTFIERLSYAESLPTTLQSVCFQYCNAFAIDQVVAATRIVEFYFSCPTLGSELPRGTSIDVRHDLVLCKESVKLALHFLPILNRISVLRRCLIDLEKEGDRCGTDYKRYNFILSIYRQELIHMMQKKDEVVDMEALQCELVLINRRIEALALLSSFFGESAKVDQKVIPSYPSFFMPLSSSIGSQTRPTKLCGVLGKFGYDMHNGAVFDPLAPLDVILSTHLEQQAAHALTPICGLLGLPGGYLQTRQLCQRFLNANKKGLPLPAFDDYVLPVLNRLKSAKDCVELAEWCSSQYAIDDKERLTCLNHAHLYAMKLSSEVESRLQNEKSVENSNEEKLALETVKRIGKKMMALKDFFIIKEVLFMSYANLSSAAKKMISSVIDIIRLKSADNIPPELLVELLLSETSLMAADASLDKFNDFAIQDFKEVASKIHEACLRISDEHSHINTRATVGTLSRRWLVHGDSLTPKANVNETKQKVLKPRSEEELVKEDDSNEFVMDLSSFGHGKGMWSDDIGFSAQLSSEKKLSVGEEPFGLKSKGSAREQVEYENARASLRIAFVLSFAHHYCDLTLGSSSLAIDEEYSKENRQSNDTFSSIALVRGPKMKSRHKDGTEYARQLLEVAFASASRTQLSPGDIFFTDTKTITFSMRHRALRTALILCPNEVIRSVIREKEYFSTLGDEEASFAYHLERCKVASYVAMEIEDMGLPLPHSDLAQLSSMNFSSYARALWRHHAESGNVSEFRGRLLSVLIDLCTAQGRQIDDAPLVINLLNEIVKHRKLPRTALSAIERIFDCESAASRLQEIRTASEHLDGEKIISRSLILTAQSLLDELKRSLNPGVVVTDGSQVLVSFDDHECYDVLSRLSKVALKLSNLGVKRINLFTFASELCNAISMLSSTRPNLASWLLSLAVPLAHRVGIEENRHTLLSKIHDIEISIKTQQSPT